MTSSPSPFQTQGIPVHSGLRQPAETAALDLWRERMAMSHTDPSTMSHCLLVGKDMHDSPVQIHDDQLTQQPWIQLHRGVQAHQERRGCVKVVDKGVGQDGDVHVGLAQRKQQLADALGRTCEQAVVRAAEEDPPLQEHCVTSQGEIYTFSP